ncbi:MAG: DUF2939 domain-containing protein [Thiohalocapsa sp.]|nr:DUF2939 domain-containing protein [Thiohalocapsa sp.]
MARILVYLLAFAVIGYGIWPYYTIFRLDTALAQPSAKAIAPFVDLPAVQAAYKSRLDSAVGDFMPRGDSDGERVLAWLADNLQRLGDSALDQAITLEWVHGSLRDAAARATEERPAYFMAGIDFAFFESWNRFVIRLGVPGNDTHVIMRLQDWQWRITDVVR